MIFSLIHNFIIVRYPEICIRITVFEEQIFKNIERGQHGILFIFGL